MRAKQPIKQPFNDIHENSGDRYGQAVSSVLYQSFAWFLMTFMTHKYAQHKAQGR